MHVCVLVKMAESSIIVIIIIIIITMILNPCSLKLIR